MEKSFREDKAHVTPVHRDRDVDADLEGANRKPSRLWSAIPDSGSAREESIARAGTRGGARELPYRAELESQLGSDLSHVKAYTGANARAAADELGAHAYATDDASVVFGDENPSKELVAHEVVHTQQQRGDGSIASDEAEADAIGGRLAAGDRIARGDIKSGGGKVRKKTKDTGEKPLVDVFSDFVMGKVAPVETLQRPPTETQDVDGQRIATTDTESVSFGFLSMSVSQEHQVKFGEVYDLAKAIGGAKKKLDQGIIDNHLLSASLTSKQRDIESELAGCDALDQSLVAGKRTTLKNQMVENARRINAVTNEIALQEKTLADLEHISTQLTSKDPMESAEALALVEDGFVEQGARTAKRTFGFNVLKGEIERGRVETAKQGGKTATSTTNQKLTLGSGVGVESGRTDRVESEDGSAAEASKTFNGKAIVKEDGTVGLGGGGKLGSSLENTYGKVSTGTSFNGAVTVNILQIPKAKPTDVQLYGVVMTLNIGAAIDYKLSKETKHGEEVDEETKAKKRNAALAASGCAEAQLTQTHVLDAKQARLYLIELEQAGNGDSKAAAKAPEFTILQKALAAGTSLDNLAGGVAQVFGGSTSAKNMAIGESTELTLKAGGSVDLSAGGQGGLEEDAKSIGGSGGFKGDAFRTLKIARVSPEKPGQELLELTVAFGKSSDMHGALTASALGVSMTAGGKQWSGDEASVTFRLDASEASYDALYDQVVSTASLQELVRLRTSTQFAEHVLAYTDKTSKGASVEGRAEGPLSVGVAKSHERSSAKGKTKEGGITREEVGSSTDSVSFGISAFDLLKRSQTDSAKFELQDGVAMLDAMEQTDSAHLGQFQLPTLQGLLAAESPAKAAEKALLKTSKLLEGYFLDPEDLARLAVKAREPAWSNVPVVVDPLSKTNGPAWARLGEALMHPKLDPEFKVDQIDVARVVARGTAIADFMVEVDHAKGLEHLHVVLRENQLAHGDAQDFGVKYEFPAGLDKAKYVDLRRKCKGVEIKLAKLIPEGDKGLDEGMTYVTEVHYELARMLYMVESATFQSERSRVEMIGELRGFVTSTANARRDFMRRISGDEVTDELRAKDEVAEANSEARQLERTLAESKIAENRLLGKARILKAEEANSDAYEPIANDLEQLYEHHVALERALRASYRVAHTPKADWKVRVYEHDELRDYDVEIEEALEVLEASYRPGFGATSFPARRDRWNHKFHIIAGE
jgi:hypothetical protein